MDIRSNGNGGYVIFNNAGRQIAHITPLTSGQFKLRPVAEDEWGRIFSYGPTCVCHKLSQALELLR